MYPPPARVPRLATAFALLLAAALTACGPGDPLRIDLDPDVRRPDPGVVIFLVDGLPPRHVAQGCAEGRLPNIDRRLVRRGVTVDHAVTCVPSITYAAIATLLTGVDPGQHQIIGNRWFDPDAALFRDYSTITSYRFINQDLQRPLIYRLLWPAPSASIQAAHHADVACNIDNWAASGVRWLFGDYTAVDKLSAGSIIQVAQWANEHDRWPTVLTCYMPGLDSVGHRHGPDSPRFRTALAHIDYQIGRICDWLESQDLLETTCLVLVSDHGMAPARQSIDLLTTLQDGYARQVTARMLQLEPEAQRRAFYDRFDTVLNDQDGRRASIHFRGPAGWQGPPTPAETARILNTPPADQQLWNLNGVDLVLYLEDDDTAIVRSRAGTAKILRRAGPAGDEFAYEIAPDDVLRYLDDPARAAFVRAGYHAGRAWLDATAAGPYPDLVPHVIPLLHLRRAGQVVVFPQPGYSFAHEQGGHGGVSPDDMLQTMILAGPGIPAGAHLHAARGVDLVPTLLTLLGYDLAAYPWLQGTPLFPPTRISPTADAPHPR